MNIFKVLSEQEVQRIHSAALEVLKTIGLKIRSEKVRGMLEEAGAIVNHETTLVHFPPNLVEESIKKPLGGSSMERVIPSTIWY